MTRKSLSADVLCDCYSCGKPVSYTKPVPGDHRGGLLHPAVVGEALGPNGETGCKAFDDLESTNDFADYMTKCREALEKKDMN